MKTATVKECDLFCVILNCDIADRKAKRALYRDVHESFRCDGYKSREDAAHMIPLIQRAFPGVTCCVSEYINVAF